jgi:hypothetical protein
MTAWLAGVPALSPAQGGPPLVTDDPDTPGDGHWENNLAATAMHTSGRWTLGAPDADLNYGWGENIQLNADIPLTVVHDARGGWDAGLGTVQLVIKWRFLDRRDLGYTLSTYPRFSSASLGDHDQQTLLNVGAHWQLSDSLALIGAAGRQFGQASPERQLALL